MNAATWARYSALLDEALDLAPAVRDAWLADLLARDAETGAALAGLLSKAEAAEASFSADHTTPPPLQPWAQAASSGQSQHQPGQSFGVWQLLRPLGQGGMGEVWLATRQDGLYEGQAALKFIRTGLAAETFAARFARERRLLARLNHPGIAKLLDAGMAEGVPYLVLEYVDGAPLLEYLTQRGADVTQRVRLLLAAAEAVQHAHGQLVAHRDLKPSNLLVTAEGQVKLLDFGIASVLEGEEAGDHTLTALTGRALTPGYAAPEQIAGEAAGAPADVFALGVLLHELLTGERPFAPQDTRRAVIEHAVLHEPPVALKTALANSPLSIPQRQAALALAPVIRKALQREPVDRYASVAALIDDLQRWLEHRPLLSAHTPWPRRTSLWLRRNRIVAMAAAAVFAVVVAGLVAVLHQARKAERQRAIAVAESQRARAVTDYLLHMFREVQEEQPEGSQPVTADQLLAESAKRVRKAFETQPVAARDTLHAIGELYFNLRDDLAAESVFRQYLELPSEGIAPEQTAVVQSYLATLTYNKGNLDEARAFFAQAQAFWNTDPVRWRAELLADAQFESRMLRNLGDLEGGVRVMQKALVLRLQESGETSAETAETRGALAQALCDAGRAAEGLEQYRLVGDIFQRLGESTSVDAIANQGIWGDEARKAGDLASAERLLTAALEADRRQFGPSMGRAIRLRSLGNLRLAQSRAAEAITLFDEGLKLAQEYSGPKSPLRFQIEVARLKALRQSGALADALKTSERLLKEVRERRGEKDPYLALILLEQVQARAAGGQPPERAGLDLAESILGQTPGRFKRELALIESLRAAR